MDLRLHDEELMVAGEEKGLQKGKIEGRIEGIIEICREAYLPDEKIVTKLISKMDFSEQKAKAVLDEYDKTH